ncbi:MAG: LamG domain-containing protein [Planctomycetota bacterium]
MMHTLTALFAMSGLGTQPLSELETAFPSPPLQIDLLPPPQDRALALDGRDDFVTVPACEAMRYPGQGGWTVELWVKPVIYPPHGAVTIVGQESVGIHARDPWSIRAHPTHFSWRVDDAQGRSASIAFDLTLGVWQHVACVYDDRDGVQSLAVYVNGHPIGHETIDIRIESRMDPVYMGALSKRRFTGLIDQVRVWSAALEESSIDRAMLTPWADSFTLDNEALRGWWAFEEAGGPVATDWSRHSNHAVLGKPHEPSNASAPTRVLRRGPATLRRAPDGAAGSP